MTPNANPSAGFQGLSRSSADTIQQGIELDDGGVRADAAGDDLGGKLGVVAL